MEHTNALNVNARYVHVICGSSNGDEGFGAPVVCPLCFNKKSVACNRQHSEDNLEQQAKKMKKLSGNKYHQFQ